MNSRAYLLWAAAAGLVFRVSGVQACNYHYLMGRVEPTGIWPASPLESLKALQAQDAAEDAAVNAATGGASFNPAFTPGTPPPAVPIDAYVTSWLINTTGAKGRSTNATINSTVSTILANVQQVAYTSTNVYIQATGIPDYNIGPFTGSPATPANSNATFDITRSPQPATGAHTATGLGPIGVLVNGVAFFSMSDSNSYQNNHVWFNNAGYVESPSFDVSNSHPQQQGVYHAHANPISLNTELGASSSSPSVIGYAIDGYPIMNDYASLTPGGAISKMMSGYSLRTYTNGVRGNGGPNVSNQYPVGYFEQDYQYVGSQSLPAGQTELDQYNGAFVYTSQFPNGTYAYFATTDATNSVAAYPYLVGPSFYGTPSSDDLNGGVVTVPGNAILYSVPEPSSLFILSALSASLLAGRKRR